MQFCNAFIGVIQGISSSITTSITSGIQNSLQFVRDAYVNTIKSATREVLDSAKQNAELVRQSNLAASISFANTPPSQRNGLTEAGTIALFKKAAEDAGKAADLDLSNTQALGQLLAYSRAGFSANAATAAIQPTARLSTVLGEDPVGTAKLVSDALAPFDIKTAEGFTKAANLLSVGASSTSASLSDLVQSIKYYRENVGEEDLKDTLYSLSLLGSVGLRGSTASIVLGQVAARQDKIAEVVGVGKNQLAGVSSASERLFLLLNAYSARLKELSDPVDRLNFQLQARKAFGERGSAATKLADISPETIERLTARFNEVDRGRDALREQSSRMVQLPAQQFSILQSVVETLTSSKIGEGSLPLFGGLARLASTGLGQIIDLGVWQKLTSASQRFYDFISGAVERTGLFKPVLNVVSRILTDITTSVESVTRSLSQNGGLEAVVTRISGGLRFSYEIFKGITRAILTLVSGTSTGANFFDPQSAKAFADRAEEIGRTIGDLLVTGAEKVVGLFGRLPQILDRVTPIFEFWSRLFGGFVEGLPKVISRVTEFFRGTGDRLQKLPGLLEPGLSSLNPPVEYAPPGVFGSEPKTITVANKLVKSLGGTEAESPVAFFTRQLQQIARDGFWVSFDRLLKSLQPTFKTLQPAFEEFVQLIGQLLNFSIENFTPIVSFVGRFFEILLKGLNLIAGALLPVVEKSFPLLNTGLGALSNALDRLDSFFSTFIDDTGAFTLRLGTTYINLNQTFSDITSGLSSFFTDLTKTGNILTDWIAAQQKKNIFTSYADGFKAGDSPAGQQIAGEANKGFNVGLRDVFGRENSMASSVNSFMESAGRSASTLLPPLLVTAGKLWQILTPIGRILVDVGRILVDVLTPAIQLLLPIVNVGLDLIANLLGGVANLVTGIADVVQLASVGVQGLIRPIVDLANVALPNLFTSIGQGTFALFDGIGKLIIQTFTGDFGGALETFKGGIRGAGNAFGEGLIWSIARLGDLWNATIGFFDWFGTGIINAGKSVGSAIWNAITGAFTSIGNWIFGGAAQAAEVPVSVTPTVNQGSIRSGVADSVQSGLAQGTSSATGGTSWLDSLKQNFTNTFNSIGSSIWNILSAPFNWITSTAIPGIQGVAAGAISAVTGFWTGLWNTVRDGIGWIANQSIPFIQNATSAYFNWLSSFWGTVWNTIRSGIGWLANNSIPFLQNVTSAYFNWLSSFWGTVWNTIRSGIAWIANQSIPFLKNAVFGMLNGINDFWNRSWKWIRETISWIANNSIGFLKNAAEGFINGVKNLWEGTWRWARNTISNLANDIKKFLQPVVDVFANTFKAAFEFAQGIVNQGSKLVGGNGTAELNTLATISILEAGYGKKQGQVDVAQSIMNRVTNNFSGFGKSVKDQVFAPGQYEPFFGVAKGTTDTKDGAAGFLAKKLGITKEQALKEIDNFYANAANKAMVDSARALVGARTDFKGTTMYGNMRRDLGDVLRQQGDNFFHFTPGTNASQWTIGQRLDQFVSSNRGGIKGALNTAGQFLQGLAGQKLPGDLRVTNRNDPDGSGYGFDYGVWQGGDSRGVGAVVNALAGGKVVEIRRDNNKYGMGGKRGFGNQVYVRVFNPETGKESDVAYGHLDRIDVKVGDVISQGQRIGTQGETGSATAPHVTLNVFAKGSPGGGAAEVALGKKLEQSIDQGRYAKLTGGGGVKILSGGGGSPLQQRIQQVQATRTETAAIQQQNLETVTTAQQQALTERQEALSERAALQKQIDAVTKDQPLKPGFTRLNTVAPSVRLFKIEDLLAATKATFALDEANAENNEKKALSDATDRVSAVRKNLESVNLQLSRLKSEEGRFLDTLTQRERVIASTIEARRAALNAMPRNTDAEKTKYESAVKAFDAFRDTELKKLLTSGAASKFSKYLTDKSRLETRQQQSKIDLADAQSDLNDASVKSRVAELKRQYQAVGQDNFLNLKNFLALRGLQATDSEVIAILAKAQALEDSRKAITPSVLSETTREVLGELGVLGKPLSQKALSDAYPQLSKVLSGGINLESYGVSGYGATSRSFPDQFRIGASPVQIGGRSGLLSNYLRDLGGSPVVRTIGEMLSQSGYSSELSAFQRQREAGRITSVPTRRSGGGNAPQRFELRFIQDDQGNQFVRREDFDRFAGSMVEYLNSPFQNEEFVTVDQLRHDLRLRSLIGLR